MKKIVYLNWGTIIAVLAACCIVYYLLLQDNFLHTSISSIIARSHTLAIKKRIILHGLLPIYIAMMIFGAAMIGIYIGSSLQQLVTRAIKNREISA